MAFYTDNVHIDGSLNVDGSIYQWGSVFTGGSGSAGDVYRTGVPLINTTAVWTDGTHIKGDASIMHIGNDHYYQGDASITGSIKLPLGGSLWIGSAMDGSARMRIHAASNTNSYIDFGNQLYIRGGLDAPATQNILICTSIGRVGIGLTSPNVALDVNGEIRAGTGTYYLSMSRHDTTGSAEFNNNQILGFNFIGGRIISDASLTARDYVQVLDTTGAEGFKIQWNDTEKSIDYIIN